MNIENKFKEYTDLKKSIVETTNAFIDDEKNSYEDRLHVFTKACDLGIYSIAPYYKHFDGVDWEKSTLFDDFYCDKYATFTFGTLLSFIKDKNEAILDGKAAIEWFMKEKISGFINDW